MSEKMYDEHEIEEMEKQARLYGKMAGDLRAQAAKARVALAAERNAQREGLARHNISTTDPRLDQRLSLNAADRGEGRSYTYLTEITWQIGD